MTPSTSRDAPRSALADRLAGRQDGDVFGVAPPKGLLSHEVCQASIDGYDVGRGNILRA